MIFNRGTVVYLVVKLNKIYFIKSLQKQRWKSAAV